MRIDDRKSFEYYMQNLNIERTLNTSSVNGQKTTGRELSNMQIFYSTHRTMKSCIIASHNGGKCEKREPIQT